MQLSFWGVLVKDLFLLVDCWLLLIFTWAESGRRDLLETRIMVLIPLMRLCHHNLKTQRPRLLILSHWQWGKILEMNINIQCSTVCLGSYSLCDLGLDIALNHFLYHIYYTVCQLCFLNRKNSVFNSFVLEWLASSCSQAWDGWHNPQWGTSAILDTILIQVAVGASAAPFKVGMRVVGRVPVTR